MQEIGSELAIQYGEKDKNRCIDSLKSISDHICSSASSGLSYQAVIDIMKHNTFTVKDLRRWLAYWLLVPYDKQTSKLFFPYREQLNINSLEQSRYKLPRSIFLFFPYGIAHKQLQLNQKNKEEKKHYGFDSRTTPIHIIDINKLRLMKCTNGSFVI